MFWLRVHKLPVNITCRRIGPEAARAYKQGTTKRVQHLEGAGDALVANDGGEHMKRRALIYWHLRRLAFREAEALQLQPYLQAAIRHVKVTDTRRERQGRPSGCRSSDMSDAIEILWQLAASAAHDDGNSAA